MKEGRVRKSPVEREPPIKVTDAILDLMNLHCNIQKVTPGNDR